MKPFYEYAFKKFGSNFSTDIHQLNETESEKLKHKMSDELEQEMKEAGEDKGNRVDDKFNNNDEKMKVLLQNAKDKKINSDDFVNELKIE